MVTFAMVDVWWFTQWRMCGDFLNGDFRNGGRMVAFAMVDVWWLPCRDGVNLCRDMLVTTYARRVFWWRLPWCSEGAIALCAITELSARYDVVSYGHIYTGENTSVVSNATSRITSTSFGYWSDRAPDCSASSGICKFVIVCIVIKDFS